MEAIRRRTRIAIAFETAVEAGHFGLSMLHSRCVSELSGPLWNEATAKWLQDVLPWRQICALRIATHGRVE
jgi:hypothetical protein